MDSYIFINALNNKPPITSLILNIQMLCLCFNLLLIYVDVVIYQLGLVIDQDLDQGQDLVHHTTGEDNCWIKS